MRKGKAIEDALEKFVAPEEYFAEIDEPANQDGPIVRVLHAGQVLDQFQISFPEMPLSAIVTRVERVVTSLLQ